ISTFKEKAVFGDITYHIVEKIDLTVGGRFSHNDQSLHWYSSGLLSALSNGTSDVTFVPNVDSHDSATNYLATVSFRPDAATTAYLRAASAYRPGGTNVLNAIEIASGAKASYTSDTLWNYEIGIKGTLWNRFLTYSLDAFHMDWTDLQLTQSIDGFGVVG